MGLKENLSLLGDACNLSTTFRHKLGELMIMMECKNMFWELKSTHKGKSSESTLPLITRYSYNTI